MNELRKHSRKTINDERNEMSNGKYQMINECLYFNGSQLAKMKKSIPDMSLP